MGRVVLLSDLHLSPTHGFFWENFKLARDAANALTPDVVIVSGDLAINGPDSDAEIAFAARALKGISAPVLALPGNHDVGDEPPGQDAKQLIDGPRIARWLGAFGRDRWRHDTGNWTLLGLNSQLPGSGLPQEAEQNVWLDAELAAAKGRRIAVIMHKPVFLDRADEDVASASCTVPAARPALMARFAAGGVELVISGHLHVHRDRVVDGVRYLWAPATSFVSAHEGLGARLCGLFSIDFGDDGAQVTLHRPDGLIDYDLAAIKQHGRYKFLRDMPECPPLLDAAE